MRDECPKDEAGVHCLHIYDDKDHSKMQCCWCGKKVIHSFGAPMPHGPFKPLKP